MATKFGDELNFSLVLGLVSIKDLDAMIVRISHVNTAVSIGGNRTRLVELFVSCPCRPPIEKPVELVVIFCYPIIAGISDIQTVI